MWQWDKWKCCFFINAPQLHFAYNIKSLIFTHNFNWSAIDEKHRGITEYGFAFNTNVHLVSLGEKWVAVFNNTWWQCMHLSILKFKYHYFTISRKLFVSRFWNDFQMNVKSGHHLSFPIVYSHFAISGTKIWFISSHYSFTCHSRFFMISISFSQLPGIASFIFSYFFKLTFFHTGIMKLCI